MTRRKANSNIGYVRISDGRHAAEFEIKRLSKHRYQISGSVLPAPVVRHTANQCRKAALRAMQGYAWPTAKTVATQPAQPIKVVRPHYGSKRTGEVMRQIGATIGDAIAHALNQFKQKYGFTPAECRVPVGTVHETTTIAGITVLPSASVLPGMLWIGA